MIARCTALANLALLIACSSDRGAVASVTDAAVPELREPDASDVSAASDSIGTLNCDGSSVAEPSLLLVPEFVTVFRHVTAECESLASRFLLSNTQASPVLIQGVGVSSRFSLHGVELPSELLPGQTLAVQIAYLGAELDSEVGTLTVSTSSGCVDFPVRGLATDGGLMTYSDLAIDFGALAAGEVSETREFVVKYQRAPAFPGTVFEGFSAGPEAFEVMASPQGPQSPNSCDEIRFQVRFRAPATPGRIEGALGWSATTEAEDGIAVGEAFVPLYGTTLAD